MPVDGTHVRAPKQRRSRQTLQRIARAALDLVAEGGVEATTVNAIVRRAGSSVGSFYARFDGKQELLVYLDQRIWEEAEERWAGVMHAEWGDRTLEGVIRGLAALYAEIGLVHRSARDALAQALRGPGAGASDAETRFRATVRADSRQLLLALQATINHPQPALAVETVCRTLEMCARPLEPDVLEDLCAALTRHLVGHGDAGTAPPGDVEFFDIWG